MTLTLSLRPDVTVVAAMLPAYATDPWLMETEFPKVGYYDPNRTLDGNTWSESIDLPPGQYEIVGLFDEITKEQAAGLAQTLTSDGRNFAYRNYTDSTYSYLSAINSLKSAIKANGGDPELNWLLLKKIQ